jgi:NAD(P) transhydrogenase
MNDLSPSYDLLVIGSGPAGQRAAVQAAKLGRRVGVVEQGLVGGTSTNAGTVPSKTLRAAILELTDPHRAQRVTLEDLAWRTAEVVEAERDVIHDQLRRNGIDLIAGRAAFVDPVSVEVTNHVGRRRVSASRFVIAVGSTPARPKGVAFDGATVIDSNGVRELRRVPRTLTVVGAGVIGLEYASMAAALGTRVTVVDQRPRILDFVDDELAEALQYHLRGLGVAFRLGEEVERVERADAGRAIACLRSGKQIPSEVVLYAAGRHGATDTLGLRAAGLTADDRGRLAVDDALRTAQPHIHAAGDVIGFPSLAATSMEQGRLAALAAFGVQPRSTSGLLPYGIYTIPELSFVGRHERELTAEAIPYVVGLARYRELSRGAIAGDRTGLLKLLVHAEDRRVLGVHAFGTAATELIHIGQAVMAGGMPIDYLVEAVFNVPTFADAYKIAALDAANRLGELGSGDPHEPPRRHVA